MNQFQFVACLAERDILRYTPAGIPIVSARLEHRSSQMEAGIARLTEFEISALAVGEISGRFNQAELGQVFQFNGFLMRKHRNSKSLVFHIVDFEPATEQLPVAASNSAPNILDTGAKNGIR